MYAQSAVAQQTGAVVVNGQVSFNYQGNSLAITNTPGSIINWRQFSIGANQSVRFFQQSAGSSVLNRVVGGDPSVILGTLQSNGRVFLINPSGILFGAGAQIDVAGLVASTLNLSNADFLAGRLRFVETPGAGTVVNQGRISTPTGGTVYLVAPDVQNSGVITSPQGEIILAAGKSVELVASDALNLRVEITAPDNQALNVGQIVAASGRIGIYAGLIKNTGTLRADGAVIGQGGEILLRATSSVDLKGTVSAGKIQVDGPAIQFDGSGGVPVLPVSGPVLPATGVLTVNPIGTVTLNTGTITLATGNAPPAAGFFRSLVAKAVQSAQSIAANGGLLVPTVTGGLATFGQGGTLTLNSPGNIVNWQNFSTSSNDITRFYQPSGSTSGLNRIIGGDPSTILGSLHLNGRVYLVNASGVVLGVAAIPLAGVTMAGQ